MSKVGNDDAATAGVVNDFTEAVGQIKKTIANIEAAIEQAKPGWQGDANTACGKAAVAWQEEGTRLNNKLDEMTGEIFEGGQTKTNMDADNLDLFTNLGS